MGSVVGYATAGEDFGRAAAVFTATLVAQSASGPTADISGQPAVRACGPDG